MRNIIKIAAIAALFSGADVAFGGKPKPTPTPTPNPTPQLPYSDRRLKRNIQPVTNALVTVMELKPVTYEKKYNLSDTDYPIKESGFIAQDLRKVLPGLVIEGTDKDKLLSVNLVNLTPILTKAIQQQQVEISKQQKQINQLEEMVKKLSKENK